MTAEVLQGCVLSPLIFSPHTLALTALYDTIFIGYVEDISLASYVSSFRQVHASGVSASEQVK